MRADETYRKKLLVVIVIAALVGAVIIRWGIPWFEDYVQSLDPEDALHVMKVALSIIFLGVLPFAYYLFIFGRKVISAERLPPPGTKVIRDTPLLEGEKARKRGQLIVVLSLFLALISLFGAFYTPYLISKVFATNAGSIKDGSTQ
jgi:hypothetical protein